MADNFDRQEWLTAVENDRRETADYYLSHFDWRGFAAPQDFEGPKYFPPDESWRVQAYLDRNAPDTGRRVQLDTSVGDLRDFDVYGTFVFEKDGQEQRLTAYRSTPQRSEDDQLFVPFRDATSDKETYGAGRYLDVPRHDSDHYTLDFNMAYNPLCAYSPRYNCPYPPPQNRLKIPVEAGEKIPFAH